MQSDESKSWRNKVGPELQDAHASWTKGNAGRARVCCRRSAGMAIKAVLANAPRDDYGISFMHHLNALADDETQPNLVRDAAWRLAARKGTPEQGWRAPLPSPLTPMIDAETIIAWCDAALGIAH